jgi:hypothetical protein
VQADADVRAAFAQTFTSEFETLKLGRYAGKEWNLRQKGIKKIVTLLEQAAAPCSLIVAVQLALKDKPEARSVFGITSVASAEDALKAHVEAMDASIELLRGVEACQREALASTDQALKASEERLNAAQTSMVAAENAWLESNASVMAARRTLREVQAADATAELDAVAAAHLRLRDLIELFEEARDPKAPAEVDTSADLLVEAAQESLEVHAKAKEPMEVWAPALEEPAQLQAAVAEGSEALVS